MNKLLLVAIMFFSYISINNAQEAKAGVLIGAAGLTGDANTTDMAVGGYVEANLPILGGIMIDLTHVDEVGSSGASMTSYGINYLYYLPTPLIDFAALIGYRLFDKEGYDETESALTVGAKIDYEISKPFTLGLLARYHKIFNDFQQGAKKIESDGWDILLSGGVKF